MSRVSAKFVLRLLIGDQKLNNDEISEELFVTENGSDNILKNIIRGDKTWVYGYDGPS